MDSNLTDCQFIGYYSDRPKNRWSKLSVFVALSINEIKFNLLNIYFKVHLCCGEQSLGSCEIPLKDLLVKNSTEIYMKPVSIEGSFQLVPPNKTKQQITPAPGDLSPMVGVSIVLRKEETVRELWLLAYQNYLTFTNSWSDHYTDKLIQSCSY